MISSSCTPFPAATPSPCMASLASQLPGYPRSPTGAPQLPNIRRMEALGEARRKLQDLGQVSNPGSTSSCPPIGGSF